MKLFHSLLFIIAVLCVFPFTLKAQWVQTEGPSGTIVQSIAVDSDGRIFVGCTHSGLFRSIDNGITWAKVSDFCARKIVVNSNGYIFAGINGVQRSTDNGLSWTSVNNGLTNLSVWSLAAGPNGYVFAGTEGGSIFRSIDNGENWTTAAVNLSTGYISSLAVNNSCEIYAGSIEGAVFRSSDDGVTWNQIRTGSWYDYVYNIAFNSSGHIFLGHGNVGVSRSTDNGVSWVYVNSGLTLTNVLSLFIGSDGSVFAGTGGGVNGGIFRSIDNGESWTEVSNGLTNLLIWALAHDLNGNILAGTGGGIFNSIDNGQNWNRLPLDAAFVISLTQNSRGDIFAGVYGDGVSRTTDNGDNWTRTSNGLNQYYTDALITDFNDYLFIGSQSGISRSTDNGATWVPMNINVTQGQWPWISALAVKQDGSLFAGGHLWSNGNVAALYRSTDGGLNWESVTNNLIAYEIKSLTVNTNGDIFAGVMEDGSFTSGAIYQSNDNGNSWNRLLFTFPSPVIALANNESGHLFAGTNYNGVFRSTDNGVSWIQINSGLSILYVNSLIVDTHGYLFTGTLGGGVFLSVNNGANWSDVSVGLNNKYVEDIAINSLYLFAGTFSDGVWRRPLSEMIQERAISLIAPNGGETVIGGTTHEIMWSSENVDNVNIEYTLDDGGNWIQTAANVTASNGSYTWSVPYLPSTLCKIKISSDGDPSIYDVSDNVFTIIPGAIQFTDPSFSSSAFYNEIPYCDGIAVVSGNSLLVVNENPASLAGVYNAVEYDYFGLEDAFSSIALPFVNPDDITRFPDGTVFVADGQAQAVFMIPAAGGTPISFVNPSTTGSPDFNPFGVAIAPEGFDGPNVDPGDLIVADNAYGSINRAVWAVNPNSGVARIIAQGSIFTNGPVLVSYAPDGTLFVSQNVESEPDIIRIVTLSADGVVTPFITGIHADHQSLAINPQTGELFFRNLGELYRVPRTGGAPQLFASNIGHFQDIEFSPGGDLLFVSAPERRQVIKITGPFLTGLPTLSLNIPNGWEKWSSGTQQNITWTSSGINNVRLEYTTDKGGSWAVITEFTPASTGSFQWNIPPAISTQCKIRITDVSDGTLIDESDNYFMIYEPSGLFTATENNLGITTTNGQFSCAWGDYDGDGYLDLYIPGAGYPNTLYHNEGGIHFSDVSDAMGLLGPFGGIALGAVWADFNGDTKLELLCTDSGLKLYKNDGTVFTNISAEMNLNTIDPDAMLWQTTAADFDKDGDLDIAFSGELENPLPIRIMKNDNGLFADVAPAMGIALSLESWNPAWVDMNNDGYMDLWVPTIRTQGAACTLLINQGGQLVISDAAVNGIAARSAITSCWGDFNNDGYMDLFLVPWKGDNDGLAKLYSNNHDGTFTDIAAEAGLNFELIASGSRGVYWGDYDNDCDLDLLIGGYGGIPQKLYRNDGGYFTEVGAETGAGFFGSFRSAVFVDYDNDGMLDIYYNEGQSNGGGQSKLLLHNSGSSNHWIGIIPKASEINTDGIGARITVVTGSVRQIRDIQGGGGGITSGDLRAHFGLGSAVEIDSVIVLWPTGHINVFKNLTIDSYNIVEEVFTPEQITQQTIDAVNELVADGTLREIQGRLLKLPLNQAMKHLERGRDNLAIISLRAFILEVRLAVRLHILTAEQAQPLIDNANTAIDLIRNPDAKLAANPSDDQINLQKKGETENITHEFRLSQNSPNPFNPTTEIQFSIPEDGYTSLKVFNILGQEVVTLFEGEAETGIRYKVTFNASELPSGIYFARLNFEGQYLVRKMLLVK